AGTAAGPDPRAAGGAPGAGAGPEPQPSLSVSGIVTDAAGSPVDGVALVLIDLTGRQAGLARTGPGGTYRLDTPAGHAAHLLLCTAPGYQPTASIVVATQADLRRDLTLVRSSSITGTVWRQDTPLGGVAVALADARGQVVAAATTSASGHYGFGHLRPGTYTISTGSGRRSAPQTVSVPAGTDLSNDVHVDTGTELAGTVQFVGAGTGEPLRAWVLLMDSSGQITLSSFTRSDGTFHFPDVQPGAYTLIAGGPAPVAQQIVVRAEPAQHVELTLGSELAADVPQVSGTPFPTSRPAGTGIGRHRTATTMNGGSANGAALDAAARDTLTKIVAAEASAGGELSAEGAAAALLLQHSGQDQATQTSTPAAARHRAAATATEVTGSGAAPSRATTRQRRGRRRRTRLTGVGVGVVLLIAGLAAMLRLVDGGHPLPLTASLHTPTAAPTSVAARMTPGAPDRHGEAVAPPPGTGAGTLILSLGRSTCQQTPSRRPAAQPRKTAHPATAPIRYTGTAAGSPAPQTEHRPSPVGAAASAACIPVRG
ncbi:MAG TPA: carboxypeptidase regulatory-like domain-containing protein, partial [Kineosporiaceae bacterium]